MQEWSFDNSGNLCGGDLRLMHPHYTTVVERKKEEEKEEREKKKRKKKKKKRGGGGGGQKSQRYFWPNSEFFSFSYSGEGSPYWHVSLGKDSSVSTVLGTLESRRKDSRQTGGQSNQPNIYWLAFRKLKVWVSLKNYLRAQKQPSIWW